ncbi:MAG TPA: Xaa-Pro peptidase family protein [Acidimicrobiales bacterium]|nr:Xaa-Pro peptidase family protein [Acidimicrobiales bacterium]
MSPSVSHDRIQRVRGRMDELGVDALLLSLGADLPWLTGYRAMALERLTLLVVARHGDAVLLVPELEAPRVPDPGGAFTVRPWSESEDPFELTAGLVAAGGAASPGSKLAVSDRAWAGALLALQQRLPRSRWVASSSVTSALRAVKDEVEIAVLRAAARAADRVAAALQGGAIGLVGRTEKEVSTDIGTHLVAEGHDRVNFAIVGSGPNGASPHHEPGARRIGTGDVVVCDFGGELAIDGGTGYCSDITRTVVTGEPDPEVRDCYAVLLAAQQTGVAAARAGVPAQDVDAATRAVIVDAGLGERFIHRTGHGIGIEEHEDPYLVAGNEALLEVGHAFSVEPGIYLPGRFGMRLEDIVVVGSDGPEALNTVDRSLVVVEA